MDLNDKIAARRREIEEAKRKEVEAEQRLQKAELHRQQQAARMAKQQEAVLKAQAEAKAAENRFKPATPIKTIDIEGDTALFNESLGMVTIKQWALFIAGAFWGVFNLFNGDWIRAIVFCGAALFYISYRIEKIERPFSCKGRHPCRTNDQVSTPSGAPGAILGRFFFVYSLRRLLLRLIELLRR